MNLRPVYNLSFIILIFFSFSTFLFAQNNLKIVEKGSGVSVECEFTSISMSASGDTLYATSGCLNYLNRGFKSSLSNMYLVDSDHILNVFPFTFNQMSLDRNGVVAIEVAAGVIRRTPWIKESLDGHFYLGKVTGVTHTPKVIKYTTRSTTESTIVMVGPTTFNGRQGGETRISAVGHESFTAQFKEWDYLDGTHVPEEVSFFAIDTGVYLLPNGMVIEAGKFKISEIRGREKINFRYQFARTPKVFTTAQSFNEKVRSFSVRTFGVTPLAFQAQLFEQEKNTDYALVDDEIGYVAISMPRGENFKSVTYLKNPGAANPGETELNFHMQSLALSALWTPTVKNALFLQEEKSLDDEIGHVLESAYALQVNGELFAQTQGERELDSFHIRKRPLIWEQENSPVEWGMLRNVGAKGVTLKFKKTYKTPVVIFKNVTKKSATSGVVRVTNVTATSAIIKLANWNYQSDLNVESEDLFYMVVERGSHELGNKLVVGEPSGKGLVVQAGRESLEKGRNMTAREGVWKRIRFASGFTGRPIVFAQMMTSNGGQVAITRIKEVSASGFSVALQEQESLQDGHKTELIGWVAIEAGNALMKDNRLVQTFYKQVSSTPTTINFKALPSILHPVVLADTTTFNDADPVLLNWRGNVAGGGDFDNDSIVLFLQEETSQDSETGHLSEDVAMFIAE